jgi:DNA sulfur modification protein DndD
MIFIELVLQNFGVYAGRQAINLQPQDDSDGIKPIILLGGMNGGGKTTLMDAIRLVLYGQRAKCSTRANLSYSDFLHQSINKQTTSGETTSIELSFEYLYQDSWKIFKVVRAWNRNSQEIKDRLSVSIDNDYDDFLAEHWDEYIENVLPLGISNLFLFDGEQVKELAELDIPPLAVIEAINSLLGLELAERLTTDLEILIGRKRKALASQSQLQTIEQLESQLAAKKEAKAATKNKLTLLEKQLKTAHKKSDRAYDKFKQEGGKLAAEKELTETKLNKLNSELAEQRKVLRNLAAEYLPLLEIQSLLLATIERGNREIRWQQFQQAKHIIEARDNKLLSYLQEIALSSEIISKIQFFIDREDRIIRENLDSQSPSFLQIDENVLQQLINIQEHLLPFQQQLAVDSIAKIQQLQTQIDLTEGQLAKAASPEDYSRLDKAVKQARQEVNHLQTQYDREQLNIQEIARQIERLQQDLTRSLKYYTSDAIDRTNDEHLIDSAEKVCYNLKLFRDKLTLKKLNKLETEVTECFRYLLHKSDLVHRVAIETDNFRLTLYDPYGQFLPKQRLSAGEKQLLAIAFLWGLARVSGRNLPIAIDTPLGRLDSSHRHNLIERYFPSASHQVILLSTDTEIGLAEIDILRRQQAISHEYLLKYNDDLGTTSIETGYFFIK